MKLLRQVRLQYREGTSDKVYEIDLCEVGPDRHVVNFRYGRRGSALRDGTKTTLPVSADEAARVFDKLVTEKTGKGYREVGASPPPPPPSGRSAAPPPPSGDPRVARILSVVANPRSARSDWPLRRVLWRAGELRVAAAALPIAVLTPRLTGLDLISAAWALARIGDPATAGALLRICDDNKAPEAARRYATEGLRAASRGPAREAFIQQQLDQLPAALVGAAEAADAEGFGRVLAAWLASSRADRFDALPRLYLIDTPTVRPALLAQLRSLPFTPGPWRAVRRIYKAAELRADGEVFGLLARRFQQERAFFERSRWYDRAWVHPHGALTPSTELKSATSRLAWSKGTRRWFIRRAWRTLRRQGELAGPDFVALATGLLLSWTDADLAPVRAVRRSDWRGRSTTAWYGGVSGSWATAQLLFGRSDRMRPRPGSLCFRASSDPSAPLDRREEAFPSLWDAHPDALADLLRRSACGPVQRFAALALGANPAGWPHLVTADLVAFLDGPWPERLELAARVAVTRFDPRAPDLVLIAAMLDCEHEQARRAAQGWVRANPSLFLPHVDFLVGMALSPRVDTRAVALQVLAPAVLDPARAQAIVDTLLGALLAIDADQGLPEGIAGDLATLIVAAFGATLRALDPARLFVLAASPHPAAREVAARLLVEHPLPSEALPDALLSALMTDADAAVRSAGMRLFGALPESLLLERYAVLLHLVASPLDDVRAAARPILLRLAAAHPAFAEGLLQRLVDTWSQPEATEGQHADLVDLASQPGLREAWSSLRPADVLRLLRSPTLVVQSLGAELLPARVRPDDLDLAELAVLCGHDVLRARQAGWDFARRSVHRYAATPEALVPLLEQRWDDAREAVFALVREHFGPGSLSAEVLVAIVDSPMAPVRALGRELLVRDFEDGDGWSCLRMLAQHPQDDVRAAAAAWLERHASGDAARLAELEPFFVATLSRINAGRVAKERVFAHLAAQLAHDRASAAIVARVMGRVVLTAAVQDRARAIALLAEARRRWPDLDTPVTLSAPAARGAHAL